MISASTDGKQKTVVAILGLRSGKMGAENGLLIVADCATVMAENHILRSRRSGAMLTK